MTFHFHCANQWNNTILRHGVLPKIEMYLYSKLKGLLWGKRDRMSIFIMLAQQKSYHLRMKNPLWFVKMLKRWTMATVGMDNKIEFFL